MPEWEAFTGRRHELVFVFKSGTKPHINNVELGRFGRNRTNVWNYGRRKQLRQQSRCRTLDASYRENLFRWSPTPFLIARSEEASSSTPSLESGTNAHRR